MAQIRIARAQTSVVSWSSSYSFSDGYSSQGFLTSSEISEALSTHRTVEETSAAKIPESTEFILFQYSQVHQSKFTGNDQSWLQYNSSVRRKMSWWDIQPHQVSRKGSYRRTGLLSDQRQAHMWTGRRARSWGKRCATFYLRSEPGSTRSLICHPDDSLSSIIWSMSWLR